MNLNLSDTIQEVLLSEPISENRKRIVQPLVDFIKKKVAHNKVVNINFICTHNSRRSHFSQAWAQAAAAHFQIPNVCCYSGGTEETALFPKVAETLLEQGFTILKMTDANNPVYAIKYDENALPVISFSKKYDSIFNPVSDFAAVLTCSQADEGCPFIPGAEVRIPIPFEDPKFSDNLPEQDEVYRLCSLEIASELLYVFSMIKK